MSIKLQPHLYTEDGIDVIAILEGKRFDEAMIGMLLKPREVRLGM